MWKKENLRKNFLRVKQIADQNLGRAEKSEVLTEDQQENEKRVDMVRQVSHNLVKKVTALLEAPPGTDGEKRLKKLPETSLSHALMESSAVLGPDTLMGTICQQCGECQSEIAKEELRCELEIEKEVLTPLQTIAEVDIPSIQKLRKQLSKSTLDMDSARNRLNSAVRQSHVPGANMASTAAKADAMRDEYDEAYSKVETIKDNLSIELCNFVSKESDHCSRLVALLEAQATYHRNALRVIEDMVPKMKSSIEASPVKPVFGMSLEDHLHVMERDISLVLEACILTLLEIGMEEEGLFRIAGSALKLKKLKACFDAHAVDMVEFATDPHSVAGALKQYLRELPEPMLTFDLYPEFMHAMQLAHDQKFQALYTAINNLPTCNYNNFRYLVKFLAQLAEKSQINKMTPSNIAIVMGPNLLWARGENTPNMMTASTVSSVIETVIIHADYFFPGGLDFHLTGRGCAPPSPSVPTPPANQPTQVSISVSQDEAVKTTEGEPQMQRTAQRMGSSVSPGSGEEMVGLLSSTGDSASEDAGSDPRTEMIGSSSPGEEIEFSVSGGYPADSVGQEMAQESTVMMRSSANTAPQSPVPSAGSPVAAKLSPSLPVDTLSPTVDLPEGPGVSPKFQRRVTKKPAPPPPPERPYTVAVTASTTRGSGNGGLSSQAGHSGAPPSSPEMSGSQQADGEKRLSGSERPHGPPPERPSTRPPERPKAPAALQSGNQLPAAAPGGHQRSASTGAMYITTSAGPISPETKGEN
ncbi:rho GTPase-activating protein 44-like isoform X4 [Babylonia areolata]|uniref:rho GTPase-activating protein 44-like isoform X4 n=1 Tax=Babylonia areolata TaxID=304850 RepID=UPI003FD16130